MIVPSRRRFLLGAAAFVAAPAIVAAPSLMRISSAALDALNEPYEVWQYISRHRTYDGEGMLRAKRSELAQIERVFGCTILPHRLNTEKARRFDRDHAWVRAGFTFG